MRGIQQGQENNRSVAFGLHPHFNPGPHFVGQALLVVNGNNNQVSYRSLTRGDGSQLRQPKLAKQPHLLGEFTIPGQLSGKVLAKLARPSGSRGIFISRQSSDLGFSPETHLKPCHDSVHAPSASGNQASAGKARGQSQVDISLMNRPHMGCSEYFLPRALDVHESLRNPKNEGLHQSPYTFDCAKVDS